MTTTSGPAWWASAFGTIIDGAGAVWVPAGCYDLCTLFKADSDFGSGRLVVQDTPRGFVRSIAARLAKWACMGPLLWN